MARLRTGALTDDLLRRLGGAEIESPSSLDENLVCYIRGVVEQVSPEMASAPFNAMLNLRVDEVTFDEAPPDLEPGAFVTSGIRFRPRSGAPLAQERAVLAELITSGPSGSRRRDG